MAVRFRVRRMGAGPWLSLALLGAAPFIGACFERAPAKNPPAVSTVPRSTVAEPPPKATAPAPTPASAKLESEYQRAIAQWREETRWGEFLVAMQESGGNEPQMKLLDPKDWNAIVDGITDLSAGCTWPWLTLHEARRNGEEDSPATKQAFIDKWREVGPALHAKRLRLASDIAEKVWKAKNLDTMRLLEKEFPEERPGAQKASPHQDQ